MSNKRRAGTELTADNWDEVEEAEDSGSFRIASYNDLQNRVIRTAKRRTNLSSDDNRKGIFSNFGGFNKTPSTSSTTTSPFSFLSNMKNGSTDGGSSLANKGTLNTESKIIPPVSLESTKPPSSLGTLDNNLTPQSKRSSESTLMYSDEYCVHLKELNQSICEWIRENVDKNPYCILTPIFEDYKKYLKEFDKYKETNKSLQNENEFQSTAKTVTTGENALWSKVTPQISPFQTPKLTEKLETKIINPPSAPNPMFSSTPVTKPSPMFSFTQNTPLASSNKFPFGADKPFTFQSNTIAEETKNEDENEEEDEPPKITFTPVVEEDSVYSKKIKVYVSNNGQYGDRGVGMLHLKPIPNSEKYQLITRADTSIGNILLNMVLSKALPMKRIGKNNVMLHTIPTPESKPPPVPVLLRVKTSEEADELLKTLEQYKR